ncbi:sulfatase-like hydrolase/transferase [Flavobacteriaceae bacterium]|nr:sulfatase-like hydrolase/transferase [Flavobacteriaceae bacterium]MDB4179852.1 sulfatase-like hydrolase/transferase [Flavobacteriaceae bacterium]
MRLTSNYKLTSTFRKMFNKTLLFVLSLSFFSFISTNSIDSKKISVENRPNFIFYLADDQDKLDYGTYGNPNVDTKAVDKLASEGIKFNNFYTGQAICAPTRSQIFTGKYPVKNGCFVNHIGVKPNTETIISYLENEGYEVVLAGKSHVKPNSVFKWSKFLDLIKIGNSKQRYLPISKIDNYLSKVDKPFCLIIASTFPHGPYPKSNDYTNQDIFKLPYTGKNIPSYKTGYYQNIKEDNYQINDILNIVDKHNLKNNSLFIYAADHGISGKWGLSEQGLKAPFIVRWPEIIKPNIQSDVILSFVDVVPTFLDIIGAQVSKDIDGLSFYKTLLGDENEIHDYIYGVSTMQNIQKCKVFPSRMIREKQYKYIKNFNSLEVFKDNMGENEIINKFIEIGARSFPDKPYEELYDLEKDPFQKNNLAKDNKYLQVKNSLELALEKWMISQDDILITNKMPLIKPTLHPLDRNSKWNKVSLELENKLNENDYIELHY